MPWVCSAAVYCTYRTHTNTLVMDTRMVACSGYMCTLLQWVWYVHILSPEAYARDCQNAVDKLVDHEFPEGPDDLNQWVSWCFCLFPAKMTISAQPSSLSCAQRTFNGLQSLLARKVLKKEQLPKGLQEQP